MKLNFPMRFFITAAVLLTSAWFWYNDGVDRGLDLKGGASLTYKLDVEGLPPADRGAVLQNTVSVIEDRVNNLGLRDLKVDALPPDQFEVQFPGKESKDVDRIKTILTRMGQLQFRMIALDKEAGLGGAGFETKERAKRTQEGDRYAGPPAGYRWVPHRSPKGQEVPDRLVEVPEERIQAEIKRLELRKTEPAIASDPRRIAEVDKQIVDELEALEIEIKKNVFLGSDLDEGDLKVHPQTLGAGYVVAFAVRDSRIQDFTDFTTRNVKRLMGIIIDGKLESAPVIQETLPGRGQISGGGMGGFTQEEGQELVTVLRSGSLNVRIILQSEFAIGPSLGEASIRRGVLATALGFGAVVLFMLGTYLFPGLVAVFALLMNLLIIMGALAFVRAQLSLPGIAGLILTVGMAVDANILIFERIREERKLGKGLLQAVKAGYDRAFVTIIDANVTTIFTAIVLYAITSGQVRGFAATLIVGILASMFTSLFVTKTIFGWLITRGWVTKMKMPQFIGVPRLSYMKIRLPMITISLVLIFAGVMLFSNVGDDLYDIEFVGGQRVVAEFREPMPITNVKKRIMAPDAYPDALIVSIKSDRPEEQVLNLDIESNSFQITIAAANREEEREKVLRFLRTEFEGQLIPDGATVLSEGAPSYGGVREYRLEFEQDITAEQLQEVLDRTVGIHEPEILSLEGRSAHIKLKPDNEEAFLTESLPNSLSQSSLSITEPFPMRSFVDPQTARGHRDDAIKAVLISLIFQILYIYFRFHGAAFGFAAVIALLHDVLITLGAIALFGSLGLVNVKINLPIIAAILTLIGYSMNDTIVVFDRIRENQGKGKRSLSEVIDLSVNQTMGRSLRTSITTLLVVVLLFIVNYGAASSVLEGFAFILIVGVLTGTYSSIFVASPMLVFLPWHYFGGRGLRFWGCIAISILGMGAMLFAAGGWFLWACLAAIAAYPLYFLLDLARWLLVKDPDRALNIVLRT